MILLVDNYTVIYVHLEEPNLPVSVLISASASSDQSSNQSANATDKVVEVVGDDGISVVVMEAPALSAGDNSKAIVIDAPGECHMIN